MGCSIQGDAIFDGHAGRVFQGQTAGYILFLGLRSVGQPTFSPPVAAVCLPWLDPCSWLALGMVIRRQPQLSTKRVGGL
jgi:hypothetical protein